MDLRRKVGGKRIVLYLFLVGTLVVSGCVQRVAESGGQDISSVGDVCLSGSLNGFSVHEWGVFVQEYNCSFTEAVNAPETIPDFPVMVKKPVVYFHYSESITDLAVNITFEGDVIVTIPDAVPNESGFGWVVDIENNSVIAPNGTVYPYLFYECRINSSQSLVAHVFDIGDEVIFYLKNIADYELQDIFYVYGFPRIEPIFGSGVICVEVDSLHSGEIYVNCIDKTEDKMFNTSHLSDCLVDRGLTEDEAGELIEYWEDSFYYRTNTMAYSQIIYGFPQEIYDQYFDIGLSVEPESLYRVGLFLITDIPISFIPRVGF